MFSTIIYARLLDKNVACELKAGNHFICIFFCSWLTASDSTLFKSKKKEKSYERFILFKIRKIGLCKVLINKESVEKGRLMNKQELKLEHRLQLKDLCYWQEFWLKKGLLHFFYS